MMIAMGVIGFIILGIIVRKYTNRAYPHRRFINLFFIEQFFKMSLIFVVKVMPDDDAPQISGYAQPQLVAPAPATMQQSQVQQT